MLGGHADVLRRPRTHRRFGGGYERLADRRCLHRRHHRSGAAQAASANRSLARSNCSWPVATSRDETADTSLGQFVSSAHLSVRNRSRHALGRGDRRLRDVKLSSGSEYPGAQQPATAKCDLVSQCLPSLHHALKFASSTARTLILVPEQTYKPDRESGRSSHDLTEDAQSRRGCLQRAQCRPH